MIPKMEVCPPITVVNSDPTVGIFNVEGGSECRVRRLKVLSYVANDLPINRYGQPKWSPPQESRTFIKNNQVISGGRSSPPVKLSSTLADKSELNSFFPHDPHALSLHCSDKPRYLGERRCRESQSS